MRHRVQPVQPKPLSDEFLQSAAEQVVRTINPRGEGFDPLFDSLKELGAISDATDAEMLVGTQLADQAYARLRVHLLRDGVLPGAIRRAIEDVLNAQPSSVTDDLVTSLVAKTVGDITRFLAHGDSTFSDIAIALDPSISVENLNEDDPDLDRRLSAQTAVASAIAERARPYVAAALTTAIADHVKPVPAENIRAFFFRPQRTYKLGDVAKILSVGVQEVAKFMDAVALDEMNKATVPTSRKIASWEMVATVVLNHFTAGEIEDALGADFDKCLPDGYHTETVALRIARHTADAIRRKCDPKRPNDIAFVIERDLGAAPDPFTPTDFAE